MSVYNKDVAAKVAEFLVQAKAVKLQPHSPFTWASGWKSPIYCDNRVTLSFPLIRTFLRQSLANLITEKYGKPDVIAGVATGAIAQGVLVAQELGVPFVYVRPSPKEHGLGNQIEGHLDLGQKVVIVEDLISTGGSSLKAHKALIEAGATVKGMAAIFNYGFPQATEAFKKAKCSLHVLCDYDHFLKHAVESNLIYEKDMELLKTWREQPESWGKS